MDIKKPKAVIGTNSWGGAVAAKVLRGSSVNDQTLKETIDTAKEKELPIFDLAQVYGLGKAQKKMGAFGTEGIIISAKFTPSSNVDASPYLIHVIPVYKFVTCNDHAGQGKIRCPSSGICSAGSTILSSISCSLPYQEL